MTTGSADQRQLSSAGCLARLFWLMFGNMAVLLCAVYILRNRVPFFSPPDAVFWAAVALLIGVRYIDIKHLQGTTSEGKPATLTDWRRYVGMLVASTAGLWVVAHVVSRALN